MALAALAVAPTTTLPHRRTTTTQHLLQVPSMPATATPLITATPLLNASSHDIAMLHDIHSLLNKLFVRNRNQHRRSTWWKALHGFRKQMALLLAELEGDVSDVGAKKTGKGKSWEKERKEKVEARLKYWDERGGVHGWYYQFSQLVAVGPFAMLGLVMMACVARVCRITGITAVYEEIASADVQGVLGASDDLALTGEFSGVLDEADEWDEGVVIAREEDDGA